LRPSPARGWSLTLRDCVLGNVYVDGFNLYHGAL
jgi:hypothetical protein